MSVEATLALARIIVRQEQEITALKQTLASTAQVAIDAEQRCGSTCTALDTAWARIQSLRIEAGPLNDRDRALHDALVIIEDLGGMDPARRGREANSGAKLQRLLDNPCIQKLADDEPFFVLLGRDRNAPEAVRSWAHCREQARGRTNKTLEACNIADAMDEYAKREQTA